MSRAFPASSCRAFRIVCFYHFTVTRNPNLGPLRPVVDIGASCGQLVAAGAPLLQRCTCRRPAPGPMVWRDARATLVEAAVGPQAGEVQIHVSARDDSSSLLPIAARQSALFPGTATIRMLRLADALPAADIAARAESRRGRRSYDPKTSRRTSGRCFAI